jgi:hypothetical protein
MMRTNNFLHMLTVLDIFQKGVAGGTGCEAPGLENPMNDLRRMHF